MTYNINHAAAFDYLQAFKHMPLPELADYQGKDKAEYNSLIKHIAKIKATLGKHNPNSKNTEHYLKLYTRLHELAENINVKPEPDKELAGSLLAFHTKLFINLYENDSKLFDRIDQKLIRDKHKKGNARDFHIHQRLKKHNIGKPGTFQFTHPENWANKLFSGLFGIDYNPLKRTNIPYIAFQGDDNTPTTLRMGTQIQGMRTLQPSFQNYLASKNSQNPKEIHHIYFNLLKRDAGGFERYFESEKTKALESINDKGLGAAVITLPADSPNFFEGFSKKDGRAKDPNQTFSLKEIEAQLIDSIKHNKNDFHIPDNVKALIFANGLESEISILLDKSINAVVGPNEIDSVNAQMRQAILFDFVKYQLSDFIVKKINPDTINFSCKDAIDRGGVHALWYEFRRRLDKGMIMSEQEFNMHLDASALLVKGRPVNDHRILIWNVLNQSYLSNPAAYEKAPWVSQWLKDNYPTDKNILKLKNKANLTPKEKSQLAAHVKELNVYSQKIIPSHNELNVPTLDAPSKINTQPKAHKKTSSMNHLHRLKREGLSAHLHLPPQPILEQKPNHIATLHQNLHDNQKQLGISHVKRLNTNEVNQESGFSFNVQLENRSQPVFAKQAKDSDNVIYSTNKNITLEQFNELAQTLCNVVLTNAKPNTTIDFSRAPPRKREILTAVFEKAIEKAILEGKYDKHNAPKIIQQEHGLKHNLKHRY